MPDESLSGVDRDDWESSRSVSDPLAVGDTVTFTKTITDADVRSFATASGDTNPLHLDADAAAKTQFGERIVHGALGTGLIGAALARFPGTVVYLSQELAFNAPITIGDRPTARCELRAVLDGDRYRLVTRVGVEDIPAIDGEAVVLIEP
ncbi:MAG: acyl dehydratase [halophilic archaeon J07HX5]|jgi:Acyl dehydratase|nr:MAG: acyl dehydratase [halophilic archaeon J07HX5]